MLHQLTRITIRAYWGFLRQAREAASSIPSTRPLYFHANPQFANRRADRSPGVTHGRRKRVEVHRVPGVRSCHFRFRNLNQPMLRDMKFVLEVRERFVAEHCLELGIHPRQFQGLDELRHLI